MWRVYGFNVNERLLTQDVMCTENSVVNNLKQKLILSKGAPIQLFKTNTNAQLLLYTNIWI